MRNVHRAAALAAGLLALAAPLPPSRAQDSLAFTLRTIENARGMRVVMGFTRKPVYEVRQERDRIHIVLHEESVRPPFKKRRFSGAVLERIRFVDGWRTSEIVFYTGEDFGGYSTFEMGEPFRLVLDLRRQDAREEPPPAPPEERLEPLPDTPGRAPRRDEPPPSDTRRYRPPPPAEPRPAFLVVVDPGHGGEENGARGPSGLLEKEVTLDIARRLKARLEAGMDVKVILTREDDSSVSLDERTSIANHNHADLFVSIHANASRRNKVHGAETWFLSHKATDDEARVVAAIENNAMGVDAGVQGNPSLEMVLWDMAQSAFLQESSELAEMIQERLNDALGLNNRGIKQAPFRVLMGATMPAVLVEVGFISNAQEERRLREPSFKEKLASVLFESIRRYNQKYARAQIP